MIQLRMYGYPVDRCDSVEEAAALIESWLEADREEWPDSEDADYDAVDEDGDIVVCTLPTGAFGIRTVEVA